jgi:hypothetical protein
MATNISLKKLIEQVRTDLVTPHKDRGYPVFTVEQIELELEVGITESTGGELEISVLETITGKLGKNVDRTNTHKMKIVLKPILTQDELRDMVETDRRLMQGTIESSRRALLKGSDEREGMRE